MDSSPGARQPLAMALALITALGVAACALRAVTPATPTLPPTASAAPTAVAAPAISYGAHVEVMGIDAAPVYNGLAAMRFEWAAQTISWRDLEPQPGQFAWAAVDAAIGALSCAKYNLRLLAVVRGTPDWARPTGADLSRDGPPADNSTLARMLSALAGRYAGRIAAYEIYPEANDAEHWASPTGLSARDYTALLQAAWSAVRAADPGAIIVSGGLAPVALSDGVISVESTQFLSAMYAAGAAQWFDVVGVHLDGRNNPPSDSPDTATAAGADYKGLWPYYFRYYERIRDVMVADGDAQRPMWLTAVGWASQSPSPEALRFAGDNTEEEQANYLVGAAYQVRERPYVQVMVVENFNLSTVAPPGSPSAAYSLIRPDWTARPAFIALAKMRQADRITSDVTNTTCTELLTGASR